MDSEALRKRCQPNKIFVLFVGESRPMGGTFFYEENSNLFRYTKEAFEEAGKAFSLEHFKQYGCWLYDVCDEPVNGLTPKERHDKIKLGLPKLLDTINELAPEYIIVTKKGDMKNIIFKAICNNGYIDQINAFNLPFPACGNQKDYRTELGHIIKKILN